MSSRRNGEEIAASRAMGDLAAPGKCVDCGNDAFIRLTSADGREDMICGHCYAERLRKSRPAVTRPKAAEPQRLTRPT